MTEFATKSNSFHQNLLRRLGQTVSKYEEYEKLKETNLGNYKKIEPTNLPNLQQTKEGFRALYPGLLHHEIPDKFNFLVNPEKLSPLLKSLQHENQILQEELQNQCEDLFKFINLNDSLIEENKSLVLHISQKNQDIVKLVESLTINECEEIQDLKHQIQMFNEENHILIKQIEIMKKKDDETKQSVLKSNIKNKELSELIDHLRLSQDQFSQREEELSKQIILIQPKLQGQAEQISYQNMKIQELEQVKRILEIDDRELRKSLEELEHEFGQMQMEKNDRIDKQNHHIYEIKMQIDKLKQESEKQIQENDYYQQQNSKYRSEIYEITALFSEYTEEIAQLKAYLQLEKRRVDQYLYQEKESQETSVKLKQLNQKQSYEIYELSRELDILREQSNQDILEREKKMENSLQQIKNKYNQNLKDKEDELVDLEASKFEINERLEETQHQLQQQTNELSELKQKLMDYKSLKLLIDAQSYEIRQLNDIILNQKQVIDEFNEQLEKTQNTDYQQIQKLEKHVLELENIVDNQNVFIKKHNKYEDNQNSLKKTIKELESEVQAIEYELHSLKVEAQKKKEDLQACMKENNNLKNQVDRRDELPQQLQQENQQLRQQLNELERQFKKSKTDQFEQTIQRAPSPLLPRQQSDYVRAPQNISAQKTQTPIMMMPSLKHQHEVLNQPLVQPRQHSHDNRDTQPQQGFTNQHYKRK